MSRFTASVGPFRRAAGLVEGEDLVAPAIDDAGKTGELGHAGVGDVLEEHDQPPSGSGAIVRRVDLRQELSSEPHRGDLAVAITGGEPGAKLVPAVERRVR